MIALVSGRDVVAGKWPVRRLEQHPLLSLQQGKTGGENMSRLHFVVLHCRLVVCLEIVAEVMSW